MAIRSPIKDCLVCSGQAKGNFDHTVVDPGFSFRGTDPAGGRAPTQALSSDNIYFKTKEFTPVREEAPTDGTGVYLSM